MMGQFKKDKRSSMLSVKSGFAVCRPSSTAITCRSPLPHEVRIASG